MPAWLRPPSTASLPSRPSSAASLARAALSTTMRCCSRPWPSTPRARYYTGRAASPTGCMLLRAASVRASDDALPNDDPAYTSFPCFSSRRIQSSEFRNQKSPPEAAEIRNQKSEIRKALSQSVSGRKDAAEIRNQKSEIRKSSLKQQKSDRNQKSEFKVMLCDDPAYPPSPRRRRSGASPAKIRIHKAGVGSLILVQQSAESKVMLCDDPAYPSSPRSSSRPTSARIRISRRVLARL